MKKFKWIIYVVVVLGIAGIGYEILSHNIGISLGNYTHLDSLKIDPNPWQPYISIPIKDTCDIYEVIWDQKYGVTKKMYCKVVFRNESAKQYKLIAPWLNSVIIEYQNTNDIKFNKVSKDNAPDYDKR